MIVTRDIGRMRWPQPSPWAMAGRSSFSATRSERVENSHRPQWQRVHSRISGWRAAGSLPKLGSIMGAQPWINGSVHQEASQPRGHRLRLMILSLSSL